MKKLGFALVFAALPMATLGGAWASDDSRLQFRNVTRTLEKVQDATASGDPSAVDIQSKLMIQMETDLKLAKLPDLQDERNLRAMAVYLFSGGNPNVAEGRLNQLAVDPESKELLDGALAYARGDKANAVKLLKHVDLATLPTNLAGRVALVKAILISAEDIKTALALLATARANMPGTLVEEAALRRCISFTGKLSDIRQLERCASAYIRRFPKSIYWKDFEDSLTLSLIEVDYLKNGGTVPTLENVLKDLPTFNYRKMLLMIAKAAVGHGRYSLAATCAEKAFELSRADSAEMARANLYTGAVMIVQTDHEAGRKKLEQIDKSLLDPSDRLLLEQASDLARQISRKPDITVEQAMKSQVPSDVKNSQLSDYEKLLTRAKTALADPKPAN